MNFIGVDLHKKSITICVMDEKRKVLARKTRACTQTDEIVGFCRQFRPFKVVVEATASYVWFVELGTGNGDGLETGTQLVIDSSCVPVSAPCGIEQWRRVLELPVSEAA